MKINFEKNTVRDGYGTWSIIQKKNDCFIAQGYGNLHDEKYAYEIGFRNQHISVMRLLPNHFYDLCQAMIDTIKKLPDDTSMPQKLKDIKKQLKK